MHHCLLKLIAEECSKGKENIWKVFFYYQTDLEIVSTEGIYQLLLQLNFLWLVYFSCLLECFSSCLRHLNLCKCWGQQLCVPPDQRADICLVLGET